MNLSDIWVITVITNFFYRMKTNIETYKAYADLGYIFDHNKLKTIEDMEMEEESDLDWFLYKFGKFILIYNFFQSLERKFIYCIDANNNIKILEECGVIEKMTIKEKEEYNKRKTGLHALSMRIKLNRRRNKYDMIEMLDGSSILFDYDYDKLEKDGLLFDSIKIIEVRGNLERKSNEEVLKIVNDAHMEMGIAILNTFEDYDDVFDRYEDSDKVEFLIENYKINERYEVEDVEEDSREINTAKKRVRKK